MNRPATAHRLGLRSGYPVYTAFQRCTDGYQASATYDAGKGFAWVCIPSLRIFDRKVLGLMRSRCAAPCGPSIRPPHMANALVMCAVIAASRETEDESSLDGAPLETVLWVMPCWPRSGVVPSAWSRSSYDPCPRIIARSITAASSRTFPGQA